MTQVVVIDTCAPDDLRRDLRQLIQKVNAIMATLADVQAAVANLNTVEASVVAMLQTLSDALKAAIASNDPAALQAVVDSINADSTAMAAAVAANTPAATTPPTT